MNDLDRLDELAAAATPDEQKRAIEYALKGYERYHGGINSGVIHDHVHCKLLAAISTRDATIRSLVAAVRERDELRAALNEMAKWPCSDWDYRTCPACISQIALGAAIHAGPALHHKDGASASRALHASGDDEPYATDEPSETSTPLKETTTWKGSAAGHMFGNDPRD